MTAQALALYAGAMVAIWLTPGPVWVAIIARALAQGFSGVWPLALGVAIGDFLWPMLAMAGLSALAGWQETIMAAMRWVAVAVFILMGFLLIRHARVPVVRDGRLTRRGGWAGFTAGLAAIAGNPKAILFYIGVLPGFVDVTRVTLADMVVVAVLSSAIPLVLNTAFGAAVGAARSKLATPDRLARLNIISGGLLIAVGLAIALS